MNHRRLDNYMYVWILPYRTFHNTRRYINNMLEVVYQLPYTYDVRGYRLLFCFPFCTCVTVFFYKHSPTYIEQCFLSSYATTTYAEFWVLTNLIKRP
jgi:hypothetical protein